jgi:hypothetical protein
MIDLLQQIVMNYDYAFFMICCADVFSASGLLLPHRIALR